MTARPPLLELIDIRKNYGAIEALRGISFSVGRGEVVALLGDNGAGKSTLVKIIAGGLPPSGGRMIFEGADYLANSPSEAKAAASKRSIRTSRSAPMSTSSPISSWGAS